MYFLCSWVEEGRLKIHVRDTPAAEILRHKPLVEVVSAVNNDDQCYFPEIFHGEWKPVILVVVHDAADITHS